MYVCVCVCDLIRHVALFTNDRQNTSRIFFINTTYYDNILLCITSLLNFIDIANLIILNS